MVLAVDVAVLSRHDAGNGFGKQTGAVLALARWGDNGGHNSSWGAGAQYAAELRILLVYLSESLGRLGQNGGPQEATFFIVGRGPPGPP